MESKFGVNDNGITIMASLLSTRRPMFQILMPEINIVIFSDSNLYILRDRTVAKNPGYLLRLRRICCYLCEKLRDMYNDSQLEEYAENKLNIILKSVVNIARSPDFTPEMLDNISFSVSPGKSARKII
jgi:hypothetical protein